MILAGGQMRTPGRLGLSLQFLQCHTPVYTAWSPGLAPGPRSAWLSSPPSWPPLSPVTHGIEADGQVAPEDWACGYRHIM